MFIQICYDYCKISLVTYEENVKTLYLLYVWQTHNMFKNTNDIVFKIIIKDTGDL